MLCLPYAQSRTPHDSKQVGVKVIHTLEVCLSASIQAALTGVAYISRGAGNGMNVGFELLLYFKVGLVPGSVGLKDSLPPCAVYFMSSCHRGSVHARCMLILAGYVPAASCPRVVWPTHVILQADSICIFVAVFLGRGCCLQCLLQMCSLLCSSVTHCSPRVRIAVADNNMPQFYASMYCMAVPGVSFDDAVLTEWI